MAFGAASQQLLGRAGTQKDNPLTGSFVPKRGPAAARSRGCQTITKMTRMRIMPRKYTSLPLVLFHRIELPSHSTDESARSGDNQTRSSPKVLTE